MTGAGVTLPRALLGAYTNKQCKAQNKERSNKLPARTINKQFVPLQFTWQKRNMCGYAACYQHSSMSTVDTSQLIVTVETWAWAQHIVLGHGELALVVIITPPGI